MALTFPLSRAAFNDLLKVSDVRFYLRPSQERSQSGGGAILYADLAPPQWVAEVTTVELNNSEAVGIQALINAMGGGLRTALIYNKMAQYPSSDPGGLVFAGAPSPAVGVVTDQRHIAFTGFPNNYTIPLGTFFQAIFDTSRYYLGQFAEAKTSNGSGAVSAVEVTPAIPASLVVSSVVTLNQPAGKFRIVPGSAFVSSSGPVTSRITLTLEQTYEQ